MRHSIKQIIAPIAGLTAIVYLTLAVLAAGCLFMHAASSGEHDHHNQDTTHSPLCAWSCQATSSALLVSDPLVAVSWSVERTVLFILSPPSSAAIANLLQGRAPPQSILS